MDRHCPQAGRHQRRASPQHRVCERTVRPADIKEALEHAVKVRARTKAPQKAEGDGESDGNVFQPLRGTTRRNCALRHFQRQFDQLLLLTDKKTDGSGKARSLYSLRRTAITFRLLNAANRDSLTLTRNARTSVEMIDRFCARPLTAEMRIDTLQSHRTRHPKAKADGGDEQHPKVVQDGKT